MKKIISLLLMVVMLLSALPAMADNVRTSGDFQYTIKGNGTATIVGYTGEHADIILPNLIDGYTITTIGPNAFAYDKYATEISVTLPETITAIEEMAFYNRNVRSINLPDSLEYIGYGAFNGCAGEIQFRISNNHPYFALIDGTLYNKTKKELLSWCYIESTSSEFCKIPEGITSIGSYAFSYVNGDGGKTMGLSYIDFPSTITKIGECAFKEATGFEIYLDANSRIKSIPDWAFGSKDSNASGYTRRIAELPLGVETIGEYSFQYAHLFPKSDPYGDNTFSFDKHFGEVEEIGSYAFAYSILGDYSTKVILSIPASCKTIGEGAFKNLRSAVVEVRLADGVEVIESKAFNMVDWRGNATDMLQYEKVYLPESLTYIANDAFNVGMEFVVEKGSYAERWAKENAYPYTINGEEQNLDWLNN